MAECEDYSEDGLEESMSMAGLSGARELDEGFTREFLSCSICWDMYDDNSRQPKLLSCHHTFCKDCLKKASRNRTIMQCPTCRKDTLVHGGISNLQTNFYVMYTKQKFGDHFTANHNVCYKHSLQPLSFFCKTCVQMVCRDCIVLTHPKSEGHDLQEIQEVKAEYVLSLEQLRQKVDESIQIRQEYLSCLRAELDAMDIVSEVAQADLDKVFDQLIEVVNCRRNQLKDTIKETHETKHRTANEQLAEIDNQANRLIIIREQLDEATCKGQLRGIVDAATDGNLRERIELLTMGLKLNLGKNYFKFTAIDAVLQLSAFMKQVGDVNDVSMLPSKLQIESEESIACLPTSISIKVSTSDHRLLPGFPIGMEIVDPTGDELACSTTDNGDGTYDVQFRPQLSGAHMCTVTFLDRKILSSCKSQAVQSNNPLMVIGSMGKDFGKLMYPCSLKIDPNNNIYVVDEGNQRIQKFGEDGSVEVIPLAGGSKNIRTFDCAIDMENSEIICSKVSVEQRKAWADTIQIYDLQGRLKNSFVNTDMKKALYVTINSQRDIIVPDYAKDKVFIYNHEGQLLRCVGDSGSGEGEFKEPAFLCVGRDDDIIISDCRNSRVQVLDKQGNFKYQIGAKGGGKGQLQGPSGVTTDSHGHILVTDRVNNRIQVFTYEGEFVCCIESTNDKLNDPRGLAVTKDGHVLVADQKNHCIKKYRYM